jgi:TPR repeat protein
VYRDGLGAAKDPAQALKWFTIASKGGYQAVDMEQILKDLRSGLSPGQIKNVEDSADQWIEDYRRRAGAP